MTSTTTSKPRPLSPHLQVYKPQISSVMSILHRATGVGLMIGLMLFVAWIVFLAGGKAPYALFQDNLMNVLGEAILYLVAFTVFYGILCTGKCLIAGKAPRIVKTILSLIIIVLAGAATIFAGKYANDHYSAIFDKACLYTGLAALIGLTWAFFYHFCCGIRHLIWDAGWFLTIKGMHITGWITLVISAAVTAGIWLRIYPELTAGLWPKIQGLIK